MVTHVRYDIHCTYALAAAAEGRAGPVAGRPARRLRGGRGATCPGGECAFVDPRACDAVTCQGDDLLSCPHGIQGWPVDCTFGSDALTCVPSEGACGAATPECEPCAQACDGTLARLCYGGVWLDWDCGAFLGATCALGDDGDLRCKAPGWP